MSRKRFYKRALATPENTITLDGRALKTPEKRLLQLPTEALPKPSPPNGRPRAKPLIPIRCFSPSWPTPRLTVSLRAATRSSPKWWNSPVAILSVTAPTVHPISWQASRPIGTRYSPGPAKASGADFQTVCGVVHIAQPPAALQSVRNHFEAIDSFMLTALHNTMTLTGSAVIAAMAGAGAINPEKAWDAAHVDEDHQIHHWGWDAEARARRTLRQREFMTCFQFMNLL